MDLTINKMTTFWNTETLINHHPDDDHHHLSELSSGIYCRVK
jgi:hypothetical protein